MRTLLHTSFFIALTTIAGCGSPQDPVKEAIHDSIEELDRAVRAEGAADDQPVALIPTIQRLDTRGPSYVIAVEIPRQQFLALPKWSGDAGLPPLSAQQALAAVEKWLDDNKVVDAELEQAELQVAQDGTEWRYIYSIRYQVSGTPPSNATVMPAIDEGDPSTLPLAVLLDGTVISPTRREL